MPTKRVRISRPRRDLTTPDWAKLLLEGGLPSQDTAAWHEFTGWRYFGDHVEGLPPGNSHEGMMLARDAEEAAYADEEI